MDPIREELERLAGGDVLKRLRALENKTRKLAEELADDDEKKPAKAKE